MVAAVHRYQDNFLLLFLCDTSTDEDIYIHLALQKDGHALPCTTAYGQVCLINALYIEKCHLTSSDFFASASSCLDSSIR